MAILNVMSSPYDAKGNGVADDTAAINATVNAGQVGDIVLVPAGATCMVNPLANSVITFLGSSTGISLKSGITLQVDGTIQAIPNSNAHYVIVLVQGCNGVTITGKGKIIGDRLKHVVAGNPTSQWGHGIVINQSQNIQITGGLTISECYGDGIAINDGGNIVINDITCDSNYRQNMSMGAVNGLKLTNSTFSNAGMTNLDMEPDLVTQTIENVLVQFCDFLNTGTLGPIGSKKVHIGLGSEPGIGIFKNINISDCQFDLRMQPIWAHDTAGVTGIPPWADALNVIFYQGLKADWYRFWGYPTTWSD